MKELERLAVEEKFRAYQNARKERLRLDCISIHGEGQDAEVCCFIGKFYFTVKEFQYSLLLLVPFGHNLILKTLSMSDNETPNFSVTVLF